MPRCGRLAAALSHVELATDVLPTFEGIPDEFGLVVSYCRW
jgi:hypothetical protein